MIAQKLLDELDILSEDDFRYPEQFIAMMETDLEMNFDTFSELVAITSPEHLPGMISAYFEDLIRGVPDDNTDLYGSIQTFREAVETLAGQTEGRRIGFLSDELFRFREWYTLPGSILCLPEGGGSALRLSPFEALMLYREEKLSGAKYQYDFQNNMPPSPDEYIYDLLYESGGFDTGGDDEDGYPEELPPDFDPTDYDPDDPVPFGTIDPFRDGLIDRDDPVIEGEGIVHIEKY